MMAAGRIGSWSMVLFVSLSVTHSAVSARHLTGHQQPGTASGSRLLLTIPPGNSTGSDPRTCCLCKCARTANQTAPSTGSGGLGAQSLGNTDLAPGVPCVPKTPGCGPVNPLYGKKRICKPGFLSSCDEVCLVDRDTFLEYHSC